MNRLSFIAVAACAALTQGCFVSSNPDPPPPPPLGVVHTTIDADVGIDAALGEGAGLFVEYSSGGRWRLWTSCDIVYTGNSCNFDVLVNGTEPISAITPLDLEGFDDVRVFDDYEFQMVVDTASLSDGVDFDTPPGASVEVSLLLDGIRAPDFIVWHGDGVLHTGAPGSPVVFYPDVP